MCCPVPDPFTKAAWHRRDAALLHERGSRDGCEDQLPRLIWVIDELDRIAKFWGKPRSIRVELPAVAPPVQATDVDGPEFASHLLDQWAYLNKVELDFSRPGKPSDNAYIEAFNARLRQKCLNTS